MYSPVFLIDCSFVMTHRATHVDIMLSDVLHKELRPAQVIVMSTLSIWSHCSDLWHWGIHTCLMSYSWNALHRKEVLTHWSPVPSSGALWEGGRISVQYLQWPFPLTGQGPMGKNWRGQTMNNRVQGWAMVPAQHAPLRDVDCWGLGGHSKDQGTSSVPQEHTWDTCSESLRYLKTQHAITCSSLNENIISSG